MPAYDTSVVTSTVATMFLVVIVGYAARKLKFLDGGFQKKLSDIIICIAQPFLIVSSITSIEYSDEKLRQGLYIVVMGLIIHAVTAAIAFVSALYLKGRDEAARTITEFGILFANCGFLGIPVMKALFGDIGGFWVSFYIIVFNIVQWTYGMLILGRGRNDIKMNLRKVLVNYGTVPCLIGIVLYLLRVNIPTPIAGAMSYVGSLCTPVSMLIIGGTIATIPLKKLLTNVRVYIFCAVKLLIVPAIVILLARLFALSMEMTLVATVVSSLPTAANVAMFGEKYDIAPDYAAHAVGMVTLLSAATVPIMMKFAVWTMSVI